MFINKLADVHTSKIGERTKIWQFVTILEGAIIGDDVNVCANCFIEDGVVIGDRTTIKSGVYLWNGVRLGDDVFIGPNVTFTNDKYPRSKNYLEQIVETVVENGASIGGGAVILPGVTIGIEAMVGAGAVVTKSVPPFAIVTGSPARITGYMGSSVSAAKGQARSIITPHDSRDSFNKIGVGEVTVHRLKLAQDIRGSLSVGEFSREIPFEAKRYFLVFNVPSAETRGEHAHHKCHQFLICVSGNCAVVADDGVSRCEVMLNSPDIGIYLPPMTWNIHYKYSYDAVLLVFASDYYDADDYIRNYAEFVELTKHRKQV